jgi:glutathione S-transferase
MYRLYWSPGCGSFAPHAALVEVNAPFELIEVDLDANQHHAPDFNALNPRAQVPVLILPDGTVITESVAIMMHIADSHPEFGLMPPLGSTQRAVAYRWLLFAAVSLYESGCRISHPQYYSNNASDHDGIREKAQDDLNDYWAMAADAIGNGAYLLGEEISVIDICLLMIAQWHPSPKELLEKHPNLARLCDTVRNRPAVEKIWHVNF